MDINMSRLILHVLAVLVLIMTTCDIRRGECQTLTGPSDISVVRGEDGTFSCSVTGVTDPAFIWQDTSVTPTVNIYSGGTKFTADTKYDNFGLSEPGDDSSSLTITSTTVEDEGTYTCAAQIVGNSDPAVLTVDIQGTLACAVGLPSDLVVDQDYTAQCIVTGSRPQVAIDWYINNNQQMGGISETSAVNPSDADLSDTTSEFTFTATKGLNAAVIACRVYGYRAQSLQNQIQESTTTLNVNYPPTSVTVTFNDAGTQVSCEVDDANPSVTYYIYRNDSLIHQGTTGSIIILSPDAADKFTCVAGNYLGNVTNNGYYTPPPTTLLVTTSGTPTTVPNPPSGDGLNTGATSVIAILALLLATSLAANVSLVILLRRERSKSNDAKKSRSEVNTDGADDSKPYEMIASGTRTNSTYTALNLGFKGDGSVSISAADVSFLTRLGPIGSGDFGDVWKGELNAPQGGTAVAIRQIRGNKQESSTISSAVQTLTSLTGHPNVVACIGYCPEQRSILYEFVSGGSLLTHLQTNGAHGQSPYGNIKGSKSRLDEASLLKFARQVANGMDFLSSRMITHGSLCAHNILMTEKKECKISDYGLIAMTTDQKPKLTRWSSPETLLNGACAVESDVWSFGIVFWEIVTLGAKPYPGMNLIAVKQEVTNGYKMPRPRHCGQPLYNIMSECWENAQTRRPTFNQTLRKLEQLLEQTQGYISIDELDTELYHEYYDPVENISMT